MPPRAAQPGRPKDERKEFFRDLAALRTRRGLTLADIADRTQFPVVSLAAVESGPEAPPLPALEAYLRGCGEPLAAWEDRWRRLDQGAAVVASDGDLPVREAGTSPLAAAGTAVAGATASPGPEAGDPVVGGADPRGGGRPGTGATAAGGVAYTIKRLGTRSGRRRTAVVSRRRAVSQAAAALPPAAESPPAAFPPAAFLPGTAFPPADVARSSRAARPTSAPRRRVAVLTYVAAVGAVVLLGGGGVALLAWGHAAGHRGVAGAAPPSVGPRSVGAPSAGVPTGGVPTAGVPTAGVPTAGGGGRSKPAHRARPHGAAGVPGGRPGAALLQVAGVGCPEGGVVVADAPAGPGWTASGGGWTGDGCDGSAVWTMDPNGNQPVPSALTWKFGLAAGVSHCTLAVFVPTLNALGVGEYAVSTGATATVSVAVSQATVAGQWVTLGSYPVQGSSLEIQVAPAAGATGDPGPGAHGRGHVKGQAPGHNSAIAASAARAACG